MSLMSGACCCLLLVAGGAVMMSGRAQSGTGSVNPTLVPYQDKADALLEGKKMTAAEGVAAMKKAFPGWRVVTASNGKSSEDFKTPTVLLWLKPDGTVDYANVGMGGESA